MRYTTYLSVILSAAYPPVSVNNLEEKTLMIPCFINYIVDLKSNLTYQRLAF
jgi:hypothetical protein